MPGAHVVLSPHDCHNPLIYLTVTLHTHLFLFEDTHDRPLWDNSDVLRVELRGFADSNTTPAHHVPARKHRTGPTEHKLTTNVCEPNSNVTAVPKIVASRCLSLL